MLIEGLASRYLPARITIQIVIVFKFWELHIVDTFGAVHPVYHCATPDIPTIVISFGTTGIEPAPMAILDELMEVK